MGRSEGAPAGRRAWLAMVRRNLWFIATLCAIQVTYVWFITAGWHQFSVYLSSFEKLADAFRAGHVHILQPPAPELLTKADPYDQVNSRYWMVDLSLWKGHYYLYWGPVPAILLAIAKSALGTREVLGETGLALFFISIAGLSAAFFVHSLWRHLFPAVPRPIVAVAMLAAAFVSPVLHLLTTGNTYIIAIAGGQAFLVLGMLLAFEAFWSIRYSGILLALASSCWGLSIGCRASLAPPVAIMALFAGLLIHSPLRRNALRITGALACALVPLAIFSAAQLWYNWIRFDSILEFGTNLQTGFFKFSFHAKYLLTNLYSYLLRPPALSCHFPYFLQEWFPKDGLPFKAPKGYQINEPVVGLLWAAPAILLIPFALWPYRYFWRGLSSRASRASVFVLAAMLTCIPLASVVPFGLYMATIRYQGDAIFALILLSVFGYFSLWTRKSWRARVLRLAGTLLLVTTILAGLALGYQGYDGHFHARNHELDKQFRRAFSICERGAPVPRFLPNGNMKMD